MKLTLFATFLLISVIILSGCQGSQNPGSAITVNAPVNTPAISATVENATSSSNSSKLEPYNFKKSDPGFATIKGYLIVFDPTTTLPDPNDAIFLVPLAGEEGVVTIPPFTVGEVPQAEVDERTGDFVFTNIQPGQYALVVLTMGQAQMPARYVDTGSMVIINITDQDIDQMIELDKLGIP